MADVQLGPPVDHNPFEGAPTLGPPIDDPFAPTNAGAQQNVVTGSFGKPEQAATAINLSQKTGTPASVIQLNPEQHKQNYNIQQASMAVDSNPAIAKFMQKPENAAVAQGATKEMDEVSQYFQNLSQDRLNNRPYVGLFQAIPEMGRMLGTSEGRTKLLDTLVKLPVEFVKGMVNFAAVPGKVASGQIDLNSQEGMDQAISMGLGIAMFGAGKPTATGIGRDIRLGRAEDIPPEANYRSYDDFMSILRGMQTRDEINAFLKKAAGGDEATPLLMIEKASGASEALDAAVQASKEQPLRESSVAAYEEFLGSHENVQGNVHIPGQALMELYKREGKSPGPGDGLMGFIPNLAQEMKVAAETGAEVAVPMSKYVANMADKTDIHDQLKDVLRVHEDGVTLEEADAIKEAEKAKPAEGEEPPKEPEHLSVPASQDLLPEERAAVRAANAANKGLFLKPFFEEAKALGISEANFDRFSKQLDKAKELELTRAVAVARRELNKLTTPAYKRDMEATRAQVEEELTNSPAFHADRFFNTDKGMLPNGTRVSKAAVEAMRAAPDEWAPHFGFESGKAMTDAINELASERKAEGKGPKWQLKKRVDDEVAKRMEAKYGNVKDNIEIAASEIALENHNVDLLTTQLRMLAEANGLRPPIGREALEKMVRNEFAKLPTSGISVEKFRRAAEKAGTRTQTAFLKKDIVEAFNGVQQQRLALVFMREAKAFQKEMDKFNANIVRLQQNRVLSNVEQRFTDQLHRLLDKLGYTNPRSEGELASALQNAPFKQFVEDHLATGAEMPVADFMLDAAWTADVGEMTVDDFRAVNESIESILHNGKRAKSIRVGEETRDFVQTVAEGVNQVADITPKLIEDPSERGLIANLANKFQEWDAMMLKMEQMLRWMDKRDKFGVFTQTVFRPLAAAKHLKNDLLKEIGNDIKALPKIEGADDDINMLNSDGTPKYPSIIEWQTGDPKVLKKKHVVMMALHSGNESNYGKLTSKFQYKNRDIQWTPADVDRLIEDTLKKGDWEHVQGWWDLFEKYWPRVEKLSREMSGIAPDKIEAREITNKHGTWKGGYVPVGADYAWPGLKRGIDKGVFNSDRWFNPTPPKRYEIARTDATYPVSLMFDNLTNTLYMMAHNLAFREPLHDAAKFLTHPDIKGAIQTALGKPYLDQIEPWLEFQAQSKRIGDPALAAIDGWATTARQRIVAVQMLYRVGTAMKHGAAAAAYTAGEVGFLDSMQIGIKLLMTPDGWRRVSQIFEESGEVRHRLHDMDRDIGEMQDRVLGKSGFKASFYHWGGMLTAGTDLATSLIAYEAGLKKQLIKNPNNYQDAIYAGEAMLRDAHGSSGITDQSAVLRSGPMYKLFTIAYGTFNHNYNRIRDIGRLYKETGQDWWGGDTAGAWEKFKTASWRGLWYVFITAMLEEWIAPIHDKEGKRRGALAWGALALLDQLSGTIPFGVREVERGLRYKGRPDMQTPVGEIASSVFSAASKIAERDFSKKDAVKKVFEGAGYLFPVPGAAQMGIIAQYLEDIKMRRPTAGPVRGMLLGQKPERK